jgi:hypothetical protein
MRAVAALLACAALALLSGCSAEDISGPNGGEKAVLLGPDFLARAAAETTDDPQVRWILKQPGDVRESYVREVVDGQGKPELLSVKWLLTQPDSVRQSYVREVVDPQLAP